MNCKEIFVDDSGFRIYYNGVIERLMRLGYWKVVPNTPNNSKLYNQIGYGTKHKKLLRSRLIWAAYHPEFNLFDKTCIIDHIDNTKLHNYIENLRCISSKENSQNRPDALGFSLNPNYRNNEHNKYIAQICVDGKCVWHGYYATRWDARNAYLINKKIYHPSAPHHLYKNNETDFTE